MKLDFATGEYQAMQIAIFTLVATAPDRLKVLEAFETLAAPALAEFELHESAAEHVRGMKNFMHSMRLSATLEGAAGATIPFKLHAVPTVEE